MIHLAAKKAQSSNHRVFKMGAVIVKGNRVLSSAENKVNRGCKYITHKRWPNTLHAEAHAILKLLKDRRMADLAGADLYVTRINKVGHVMDAKPCGPCMELIKAVGIRRVFFTTNEGEVKCL